MFRHPKTFEWNTLNEIHCLFTYMVWCTESTPYPYSNQRLVLPEQQLQYNSATLTLTLTATAGLCAEELEVRQNTDPIFTWPNEALRQVQHCMWPGLPTEFTRTKQVHACTCAPSQKAKLAFGHSCITAYLLGCTGSR